MANSNSPRGFGEEKPGVNTTPRERALLAIISKLLFVSDSLFHLTNNRAAGEYSDWARRKLHELGFPPPEVGDLMPAPPGPEENPNGP